MSQKNPREPVQGEPSAADAITAEETRVAARRRFLRAGAGGSAALVMTVTHKRAFAGMKKGVVASNCASLLQGTPDLTGMKHKKPLEFSAMGTPKNLICRTKDYPQPIGNCAEIYPSRYVDVNGNTKLVADGDELNKGCGRLDNNEPGHNTLQQSYNYRLYGQDKAGGKLPGYGEGSGGGYCPVVIDANGDLNYVQMNYYKLPKVNNAPQLVGACTPPPF